MRFLFELVKSAGAACLGLRSVVDATAGVMHLPSVAAKSRLGFFFLSCLLMTASAQAGVVTYTLSGGTIDGSLGATSFSGKSFTITVDVDPASFTTTNLGLAVVYDQLASPTMTIDGLSPFVINESSYRLFIVQYAPGLPGIPNGSWGAGFGMSVDNDYIATLGIPTGDLINGPGSATGTLELDFTSSPYQTDAGTLSITAFTAGSTTFTVSGGATVPEPTSMAIFGLGALGLAYRARRKAMA